MRNLFLLFIVASVQAVTVPLYIETDTQSVVSPDAPTTLAGYGITDAIPAPTPTGGAFLVGNGSDWVVETDFTAQNSLGLLGSTFGGQLGSIASTGSGGAVGSQASSTNGFAGGSQAWATSDGGVALGPNAQAWALGAVQVGTGTNIFPDSIQFLSSGSVSAAEFGLLSGAETVASGGITSNDNAVPSSAAVVQYASQKLQSTIIVTQASDLAGVLDSSKAYILDGVIDMGTQSITVPVGGLTILGQSFDISGLTSSEDNYTMFVSESIVIGSGNLLMADVDISVTGTNSKVYELYDATGFNAIETSRINYSNCASLGDLYDYRQGLELGSGRFGGKPNMTLHGLWRGGFRITTSIVRNLDADMTGALFQSGTLFQMNSRFLTDINCDLPASAALHDFSPINFPNPGTVQFTGCEITRDEVYNADDANLTPNMDRGDLSAYWKRNNGLPNTFVGGTTSVISEIGTTISDNTSFFDINGVFLSTGLEHFTGSISGELTHVGNSPREFEITANLIMEGPENDELTVRFQKWDASESMFVDLVYTEQTRTVNKLQGGRDVAYFTLLVGAELDINDYLKLQVRNAMGGSTVTLESSSYFRIQER